MKRRFFLKCAGILTAGAWSVSAVPVGRPPEAAKRTSIQLTAQLKAFVKAKEEQARRDTQAAGETVPPEVWAYFAAASQGNWTEVSRLWEVLARRSGQYETPKGEKAESAARDAAWQPVLEVDLALRAYAYGDAEFADAFGLGIIESIPPGSIYFGGTDPGRGLVTALCRSQINGDPFFTLTQNALADGSYLAYLRRMYGSKIEIPSDADSQKAFAEYLSDATVRLTHDQQAPNEPKQVKPGENLKMENGHVQVGGQVSVMAINGLLTKLIFDKNPDREFYIEESFPLDWMYPYLVPHGLILKINRQPLDVLSENDVVQDRQFWSQRVKSYLGDEVTDSTTVKQVCDFAERVFVEKDLSGFHGNVKFVQDGDAGKEFSKLRTAIGGVYAWRMNNAKSDAEKVRMTTEAELALRQAFALCPYSPEALFRYVNLLISCDRRDDAVRVVEIGYKLDPSNAAVGSLRENLKKK